MSLFEDLKQASTKIELASILGVNAAFLTRTLYKRSISSQYYQFQIPKRTGGFRLINAPTDELKDLQSKLSVLLLDCIDEINKNKNITPKLSHGFVRKRSIITNSVMHENQKNVLNIDLSNFFDSFNFGRVRGFFIKNDNFKLDEHIATVLAKISCFNNILPQGSPCSPVITNLITHSLDIRLASLAKKYSCIYSRYADDITFSTRKKEFPIDIVMNNSGSLIVGNSLKREIEKSGFSINVKKTRVQFKDSRQDVTGLVVNDKVNIKSEYWRITRAMCHRLFMTGSYSKIVELGEEAGSIYELDGRLNFIDSIDKYNRLRPKGDSDNAMVKHNELKSDGATYRNKLNVRERTFSKFLYYRNFYANEKPTILCEGKTDNIYLKAAINVLAKKYPLLANKETETSRYELLVDFFNYSKRTKFLLGLDGGGDFLKFFVRDYIENSKFYKAPNLNQPVILLLDNDSGPSGLLNYLKGVHFKYPNCPDNIDDMRNSNFISVIGKLYIILTPKINGNATAMEDFFDQKTRDIKVDGRTFDPSKNADTIQTYSKYTFATKVVKEKKLNISFDGFNPILERISEVIQHNMKLGVVQAAGDGPS